MKIALCQTNPVIGDIAANAAVICRMAGEAAGEGADVAVFPEYALSGFAQGSFNMFPGLTELCSQTALAVAREVSIPVIMGSIETDIMQRETIPVILILEKGGIRCRFEAQGTMQRAHTVTINGKNFLLASGFAPLPFEYSCDVEIRMDSTLFTWNSRSRERPFHIHDIRHPLIYVNLAGGQGEYIYTGGSLCAGARGEITSCCPMFEESMVVADTTAGGTGITDTDNLDILRRALVSGIRDYARKSGFSRAVIGLSGGIDSALTAYLACEALGADNVMGITMPSPFSSTGSIDDSVLLAQNLGMRIETIPITRLYSTFREELAHIFKGLPEGLAEENIQARARGSLLMAVSNKTGAMVLATGNKSELAMGYCTLYGDMCGSLAVISDLYKMDVYSLSRYINREKEIIPAAIIEKAPSAELRENQKDEDSLPPYPVLDAILHRYLDRGMGPDSIISEGFDPVIVRGVINQVIANEFKRRQAAPGLRVSRSAFGIDRSCPVLNRYRV